jgi:hypothetical protein
MFPNRNHKTINKTPISCRILFSLETKLCKFFLVRQVESSVVLEESLHHDEEVLAHPSQAEPILNNKVFSKNVASLITDIINLPELRGGAARMEILYPTS